MSAVAERAETFKEFAGEDPRTGRCLHPHHYDPAKPQYLYIASIRESDRMVWWTRFFPDLSGSNTVVLPEEEYRRKIEDVTLDFTEEMKARGDASEWPEPVVEAVARYLR